MPLFIQQEAELVFQFIVLLHVLGAVGMGFYLVLPFIAGRLAVAGGGASAGLAQGLKTANRIGQVLLIVQFLTGGYLMSQIEGFQAGWMIAVLVLLVAIGAFSGIIGKPLSNLGAGTGDAAKSLGKVKTFSWLLFIAMILMIICMVYQG
jgi:uncharacterized membrane protein